MVDDALTLVDFRVTRVSDGQFSRWPPALTAVRCSRRDLLFPPDQNGFAAPGRHDVVAPKREINMARSTPLWQRLIWAVMFLLVCEGVIRKLVPSLQTQIYLLKDGMLVAAYIGFISSRLPTGIHSRAMRGLSTLLLLSVAYFGIQLGNPNSPSILLSIVGF